ncbi:MAG: dienelactone hydrolase family protein, partial [Panacagrimonas sp.]
VVPDGSGAKRPGVLVAHQWGGRDAFAGDQARRMAQWGYAGFALDMYGAGVMGNSVEENSALMAPFMADRSRVARRMQAALDTLRDQPEVDENRIAAIGFCFGGLCALDLARSGAEVRAVASFHGLLKPPETRAGKIGAKVLVMHGSDDPLAPLEDVFALRDEMSAAQADYQVMIYGNAKHAFAVPGANNPGIGTLHNVDAERRSMALLRAFLAEALA